MNKKWKKQVHLFCSSPCSSSCLVYQRWWTRWQEKRQWLEQHTKNNSLFSLANLEDQKLESLEKKK
jgi:hypothetical protein